MPLNRSDLPADVMSLLAQGAVIPAHPLALDSRRQFDRRRQLVARKSGLDCIGTAASKLSN